MKGLLRYPRLFLRFFTTSAIAELEFRFGFTVNVVTDVIWYITQASLFEVLFRHTQQISGWNLQTTRVFMGLVFVTDAIWMFLISENLDRLSEKVRKGELDFILAKPIDSQFMMSLQKMNSSYLIDLAIASTWLGWAISQIPGGVSLSRILCLAILIPCGICLAYTCKFIFAVPALFFARAENVNYIFYQIYRLGLRPDSIYPTWLRWIILTAMPVGFIASVPAHVLLGKSSLLWLGVAVLASAIGLTVTRILWNLGLRSYSSASS